VDVTVPPKTQYMHPTVRGHTVFAYVIEGKGCFCKEKRPLSHTVEGVNYFDMRQDALVGSGELVLFEDGDHVMAGTEDLSVRFLLISGRPIGEPVAWYGPIVMNTNEELQTAFEDYSRGTFVKTPR
jgi:quercetin 2,3-dioxygenase